MKKIIVFLLLVALACAALAGCSDKDAIPLEDGQTLKIVDNTLGEGEDKNLSIDHTFTNATKTEKKGYVYVMPISETNPALRYFISVNHDSTAELLEITDVTSGATVSADKFISDQWQTMRDSGMKAADELGNTVHFTTVTSYDAYRYKATKGGGMTIWGNKTMTVTVTYPSVSETPLTFTVLDKNFRIVPLLLSHKGDSWEVVENNAE